MIKVSQTLQNVQEIINQWPLNELQKNVLLRMADSPQTYSYEAFGQLRFELKLRKQMVQTAVELDDSGVRFAVFSKSKCNERYWTRTENGGFQLRPDVNPADGIRDIFQNGRQYAFECTTAMMIVCYKAILESIDERSFNSLFPNLFLWDGYYDDDLGLMKRPAEVGLAGDIRYFKNPDHDPETPEWQGENTIDLGDGRFYGHGIGIGSAEMIIRSLNRRRRPGAVESAYLMDEAIFPNFRHLSVYDHEAYGMQDTRQRQNTSANLVLARIGSRTFIHT